MMRVLPLLTILTIGCSAATMTPEAPPPEAGTTDCQAGLALVNASLWFQSAAEYQAVANQSYNVARRLLDERLASPPPPDKPLAVILDLDETAIDNGPFEGRMVHKGITYDPQDWLAWVKESSAAAIPGAAAFLAYVQSRGITPFYITNRKAEEEPATRENLRRLGYPLTTEDNLFTRGEKAEWQSSNKSPRREWVTARYHVLLILGDDLNDFVDAHDASPAKRLELVRENMASWGSRWLILPNPMYGSWERAVVGSSTGCEALQKKIDALRR